MIDKADGPLVPEEKAPAIDPNAIYAVVQFRDGKGRNVERLSPWLSKDGGRDLFVGRATVIGVMPNGQRQAVPINVQLAAANIVDAFAIFDDAVKSALAEAPRIQVASPGAPTLKTRKRF